MRTRAASWVPDSLIRQTDFRCRGPSPILPRFAGLTCRRPLASEHFNPPRSEESIPSTAVLGSVVLDACKPTSQIPLESPSFAADSDDKASIPLWSGSGRDGRHCRRFTLAGTEPASCRPARFRIAALAAADERLHHCACSAIFITTLIFPCIRCVRLFRW